MDQGTATETRRLEAVAKLGQLVQGEENFYFGKPQDEKILHQFLHFTDYDAEKAFEKMKQVFGLKLQHHEFFAHRRDPDLHDVILRKGIHLLLENRDQLGRRIYLLRLGNLVYGAHLPHEMFQVDDLWLSLALDEEETQRNGLVLLIDMQGMPWKFLRYFTPHIIRVSTSKAENIPLRHIQYHIINAGLLLTSVVQLVFPFLSQATKEVVFFHKSIESLHNQVCSSALPEEYGGGAGPLQPASLVTQYLDARNSRLSELLSYGYSSPKKDND